MSEQPPTYEVGQIVNGHRWTGTVWEPVAAAPGATAVAAPPAGPPTKKPIWKRWWFWVLAVLLLFIIIGAVGGGGNNTANTGSDTGSTTAPTASTPAEETQPPAEESEPPAEEPGSDLAGLNTPVRDGKFEFTVTKVKCGVESVGPEGFGETAQGQFCLISVTVKNIGDEAQTLFDSNQVVFDKDEKKYEADTAAALYANKDSSVFIEEINPGNEISGILVFDMPKNVKPAVIELHDSAFSGGVQVSLT